MQWVTCLDNQNTGWAFVFIVIGAGFAVYLFLPQSSEIPPTPAWSTINLNDTVENIDVDLDASQYNRKLYIVTDGSIILEGLNSSGVVP